MLIILGESGSGKTTLQKYICDNTNMKRAVSCTTRPKRDGEVQGKDYYFINDEEFNKLESDGFFLETATYSSNWRYGLPKSECTNDRVAILTPKGLRKVKEYIKDNQGLYTYSIYLHVDRASRLAKLVTTRPDLIDECIRRNIYDLGAFDGIKDEVDYVIDNYEYRYSTNQLFENIKKELINKHGCQK